MAIEIDLIEQRPKRVPKPEWLKVKLPHGEQYERVKAKVDGLTLNTVCKEANCPNLAECWGAGTATIMILGDTCTRGCRFCNVKTGNPKGVVDWMEPVRVAEAVRDMGWKYLVVTAVDRDDLPDGGALIFANTVRAIHERVPGSRTTWKRSAGSPRAFATSARSTINRCACSSMQKSARPSALPRHRSW